MISKHIMGLGPKEDNIHILFYNDLVLPNYPDLGKYKKFSESINQSIFRCKTVVAWPNNS